MTELKSTTWTGCGVICPKCREALAIPDWSEFVSDRLVHNLWSCTKCDNRFKTEVVMPAGAGPEMSKKDWEEMFPQLLVM